jgi:hypothetical protein
VDYIKINISSSHHFGTVDDVHLNNPTTNEKAAAHFDKVISEPIIRVRELAGEGQNRVRTAPVVARIYVIDLREYARRPDTREKPPRIPIFRR